MRCPVATNYQYNLNNVLVPKGCDVLCEVDSLFVYDDYVVFVENKTTDRNGARGRLEKQIERFKDKKSYINSFIGLGGLPVFYFYAHYEKDELHLEYYGVKK